MAAAALQVKIKNLAEDPGVYLMKDTRGEILYVGKAKNLRNRVSSYFQEGRGLTPRIQLLVKKINDFEVVITDSEAEALVLECNLIKKYKPRYNVRLKDDKSYPYVRLDVNHPFPRLQVVRKVRKDGARYFGPFVSAGNLWELMGWARKAFQLRDCSDNEFRNRSRPCILHQMGQCSAPCVNLIDGETYGKAVDHVLKLLEGKHAEVLKAMKAEMAAAAEAEEFEKAGELRDRIERLELFVEENKQKMLDPESDLARDVIHFVRSADGVRAMAVVMASRGGQVVGVFQFPFTDLDPDLPDGDVFFEFLAQYYLKDDGEANPLGLPEDVLLPPVAEDGGIAESLKVLRNALNRRVDFRVPKRGEAAELVTLVRKSADQALSDLGQAVAAHEADLADVQRRLKLEKYPRRIECFDISHFQGEGTVASRVVFIDGKPEKTLYRHYHVQSVEGPDDFKSMLEVLTRRFSKDEGGLPPDLVVIDGGRGQLKQAETVFAELGVQGVDLVSLAKARTESDFEATEVEASMERVFKPGQKNPILLKPGTGVHRVLTQARDESHRFAITFHRQVRDRARLKR